jgi:hypothetical protein
MGKVSRLNFDPFKGKYSSFGMAWRICERPLAKEINYTFILTIAKFR